MRKITAKEFQSALESYADQCIANHEPLPITRKRDKDFMIIGAEDREQIQETLYVLQNASLMQQIKQSLRSHRKVNVSEYLAAARRLRAKTDAAPLNDDLLNAAKNAGRS
ncbi:Antitoxin component YafN of the YafNO toxin-antitoxin module, PHD/YefM family [Candidatus Electrothrix marina]|uniref:Antitoxin n=1 Tax=Candidatus Electrothrix marina TaxID=1859130 RepID=A0A444JD18_9BACT|nr:Antitoxin component YafN of the YafNO toxin-antitoxin module, PHD/YefM family [Candidatus Electrothrix marina]RWX50972.1 Antitoxin component YafN of the YafNO toxin-antitoxin module, PHD/YefM family [Candidatus Electrothrix marina]